MKTLSIIVEDWTEDDDNLQEEKFVAYIQDERYKGIVESGDSLHNVLMELSISVRVKEMYDSSA